MSLRPSRNTTITFSVVRCLALKHTVNAIHQSAERRVLHRTVWLRASSHLLVSCVADFFSHTSARSFQRDCRTHHCAFRHRAVSRLQLCAAIYLTSAFKFLTIPKTGRLLPTPTAT